MLEIDVGYGYYFNDFCKGQNSVLSAEKFEVYKSRAARFLTGICIEDDAKDFEEEMRDAVCAIAEKLFEMNMQGNIKNENIDGYSVTYTETEKAEAELLKVATLYLGKSGMLYAGVE
jgi:hypothetical protein